MNITSLEIVQATMDMFFCLFCLIMFVSIKANNPKQKSMRMFVRLFLYKVTVFSSKGKFINSETSDLSF